MRAEGLFSPRGMLSAMVLAVVAALLGWLCVRSAMVQALPARSPSLAQLAAGHPDVVLSKAVVALVKQRGVLDPAMLTAVRHAAVAAPLDARPFLILGHQQLLDGEGRRAVATLEAGQRLDPRQRLIHLLLLDRYLRTGRYADAAAQFSIAARLVGPAQGPIATAMARMSMAPETHDAVRRTLRTDPALERLVLVTLAKSNTDPAAIFALASPTARRDAGDSASWGPVLVSHLVEKGRYAAARAVWQNVYHLSAAQVVSPVFDAGLRKLPGSPPFNWSLVAGSLGAADVGKGSLSVDYYGRDNGDLASQLLVLRPGTYRFGFTVDGSKTAAGPSLFWSLRCATGSKTELMNTAVVGTGTRHRVAAGFTVPSNCPAQQLTLTGNAGEFPAPVNVVLRDLEMRPAVESQR
jgi:hypothetical protein